MIELPSGLYVSEDLYNEDIPSETYRPEWISIETRLRNSDIFVLFYGRGFEQVLDSKMFEVALDIRRRAMSQIMGDGSGILKGLTEGKRWSGTIRTVSS